MMKIERGNIVLIKSYGHGHIQNGIRPHLVLQNNIGNKFSPTTITAPLTSELKKVDLPTHEIVSINDAIGLKCDSMVLCEQITTIDKNDNIKIVSKITNEIVMTKIAKACSISLALN